MRAQRIAALEAMLEANPDDAFALYGLALERKVAGELEAARTLLEKVIVVDPAQLYGFYQLGEVLIALDEPEPARVALTDGLDHARAANDEKAAGEIIALLDEISE